MSSFDSIHTAAQFNSYVRSKVEEEVNRLRPGPRTARVVEIMEQHCTVQYSGEDTIVKVPYNNLKPTSSGQVVLIDGPMGDRRIVEVMGRTSFESRIEATEDFEFNPPLWFQSMTEYPESYPVMLSNHEMILGTTWVNATLMSAPRNNSIVRIEIRLRSAVPNATLKLSLYSANNDLTLFSHIETQETSANTPEPGITLSQPHYVAAGSVLLVAASRVSGNEVRADAVLHPRIPVSRENQFASANFTSAYQGNDVTADLFSNRSLYNTLYGVALTYIV